VKLYKKPDEPYAVGYGKPPKGSQFKPGQSGNPHGRKKKVPSVLDVLVREADRTIKVQINGTVKSLTKREVLARKLMQMAMEGDLHAARLVVPLLTAGAAEAAASTDEASDFLMPDDDALERIVARLSGKLKKAKK
jgi:hypothetical protein